MSELRGIYTLWLREIKRYIRDRTRVITSFVQPLLWLVLFGSAIGASISIGPFSYPMFIFPGVIGQTLLITSMIMGISVIWDREFGFLKEILVAPISRISIFIGKMLGNSTDAMIQGVIAFLLSFLVQVPLTIEGFLLALPIMLLITFGLVCIGLTIASLIGSLESFGVIQSFVTLPLFFLSGAIFPLSGAPVWLQTISAFNPLTYGVDALRTVLIGAEWVPLLHIGWNLLIVGVFDIGMMLVGIWAFSRRK
jgi:ABC-2 type transport system permease protein